MSIAWCLSLSLGSLSSGHPKDLPVGEDNLLVSRRFPRALTRELRTACRPAKIPWDFAGSFSSHPLRGIRDSRSSSAGIDVRRGSKIHGEERTATVARVEDLCSIALTEDILLYRLLVLQHSSRIRVIGVTHIAVLNASPVN